MKNKGFTLVETLISLAIVGVIAFSASTLMIQLGGLQNKAATKDTSLVVRMNLLSLLQNEESFRQTMMSNLSMACLRTIPSTCSNGAGGTVRVYNVDGNLYYDSSSATAGFDREGAVCPAFGPNTSCIIRYNISWTAVCGTTCDVPIVKINGVYQSSGANGLPINSKNYDFEIVVPLMSDALWITCAKKGRFFLPSGMNGYAADSDGCINPEAFKGAQGPAGPQGPAGAPAVCPTCS